MSIITTRPQLAYPLSDEGIDLASGATPWANPAAWTPFFTTTAPTALAGIVVRSELLATFSHLDVEVGIGIGATPTEIGCYAYYGPNSGVGGPSKGPEPQYPVGTIPSATLISARLRSSQVITLPFSLLYYENYDGDIADYSTLTLGRLPAAADMVSITPSGTEWLGSDWVPIGGALDVDTDVVALLMSTPVPDVDCRWQLGRLVEGGSIVEHVTTFSSATRATNGGRAWSVPLPKPYPFVTGETVHVKLRKSGTSTSVHKVALQVFRHQPDEGEGVIGPLVWATISFRPPVA